METDTADDEDWHGLDEGQVRLFVRRVVKDIALHEVESYPRLVRQFVKLRQLVADEIASGLQSDFNNFIEQHDKSSPEACRRLAKDVERDLASLGLAIRHPKGGFPARLRAADTPTHSSQSNLRLEPIDAKARQHTIVIPSDIVPKFELTAEPPRAPDRGTGPGRGR